MFYSKYTEEARFSRSIPAPSVANSMACKLVLFVLVSSIGLVYSRQHGTMHGSRTPVIVQKAALIPSSHGHGIPNAKQVAAMIPSANGNKIPNMDQIAALVPSAHGSKIPNADQIAALIPSANGNKIVNADQIAAMIPSMQGQELTQIKTNVKKECEKCNVCNAAKLPGGGQHPCDSFICKHSTTASSNICSGCKHYHHCETSCKSMCLLLPLFDLIPTRQPASLAHSKGRPAWV